MNGQRTGGVTIWLPLGSWAAAQKSIDVLVLFQAVVDNLKTKVERGEITEAQGLKAIGAAAALAQETIDLFK